MMYHIRKEELMFTGDEQAQWHVEGRGMERKKKVNEEWEN